MYLDINEYYIQILEPFDKGYIIQKCLNLE